ncbi:hypothetical protein FRC05_001958 [Tulasnella sp. 425]|nr:hypothetical protein FRC05_001958 [Tulasnella sp. 425]
MRDFGKTRPGDMWPSQYGDVADASQTSSGPEDTHSNLESQEKNQREGDVIQLLSLSAAPTLYVSEWLYNEVRIARSIKLISSSQPPTPIHTSLPTLNPKTHSTSQMDSYFTFTSFASSSATSKPEEVVIVDQEGGTGGGNGYCTIA